MPSHIIHLLERREVAEGTMEFIFDKPADFSFKAGQNADYTLINPTETDKEGNKRTFSFVSKPEDKTIMWATRMRDTAFKRTMKTLPIGAAVQMDGPFGDMTLHQNVARAAIFLAGGIGITPFYSMAAEAVEKKLPHKIFLFYANRRPEDAAFLQELLDLEKINPNFHCIATMASMAASARKWDGETERINQQMIQKYIGNMAGPMYYLAGPPAMVAAMKTMLSEAGISSDDIRAEDFLGY